MEGSGAGEAANKPILKGWILQGQSGEEWEEGERDAVEDVMLRSANSKNISVDLMFR